MNELKALLNKNYPNFKFSVRKIENNIYKVILLEGVYDFLPSKSIEYVDYSRRNPGNVKYSNILNEMIDFSQKHNFCIYIQIGTHKDGYNYVEKFKKEFTSLNKKDKKNFLSFCVKVMDYLNNQRFISLVHDDFRMVAEWLFFNVKNGDTVSSMGKRCESILFNIRK